MTHGSSSGYHPRAALDTLQRATKVTVSTTHDIVRKQALGCTHWLLTNQTLSLPCSMQIPQCVLRQFGVCPNRSFLQGEPALSPCKHASSAVDMNPLCTQAWLSCEALIDLICYTCNSVMCVHGFTGVSGLSRNASVHGRWEERLHCTESLPDASVHWHKGCVPEPYRCAAGLCLISQVSAVHAPGTCTSSCKLPLSLHLQRKACRFSVVALDAW